MIDTILDLLFKPDLEINENIGRYLACQQYQQCAYYLHKCLTEKPKELKRSLNYLISHSRNDAKMHRYKMVNELYELCFKEKSKYYKDKSFTRSVLKLNKANTISLLTRMSLLFNRISKTNSK